MQTEDWNDDDAHPNYVEMSTRRTLRLILQVLNYVACRPHTTGAIPRRQAEALHRRALAGSEAHLGANHPDTLTSMNNLAILLEKQGKLEEAGLRPLDGER